jgi:hypothetical protein
VAEPSLVRLPDFAELAIPEKETLTIDLD